MKPQHLLNQNEQQQQKQQQHLCGRLYGLEHQEIGRSTFKSDNSDSPAESPTMPHSDLNGPNRLYTNMKYNSNSSGSIPVSSPNRNLSPSSYAKLRCSEQLASPSDRMVLNQDENVVYSPNYYASSPATTSRDFGSARQTPELHHLMAGEQKFATFRSIHDHKQLFHHSDTKDFHRASNETNPHPHPHFLNAFDNNFEHFQRDSQRQSKPITTNDNNRINLIYGTEPFDYFVPNDYENNEKKLQNIQHQYALHQHHLAQQGHFRMRKNNRQISTTTTTTTTNNDSNNNTHSNDRSLAYEPDSDETDSHEFDREKTSSNASEFNCGNNDTKHLMPIKCKSEAINEFSPMKNLNKIHLQQQQQQMKPHFQVLHDNNLPGSMIGVNFRKLNNEHNDIPADECDDNSKSHVNL